ncbi:MAG: T9SS type A sorting domain-containing protein [Fibrobacterales bacterium]
MRLIVGFIWVMLLCTIESYSQSTNAYYIGHSLTDYIPSMVHRLSEDRPSVQFDWEFQSIPGSPLVFHWGKKAENNPSTRPHARSFFEENNGLPAGDFDAFIMTESVPRNLNNLKLTHPIADSFYLYAEDHNPGIQVYVYEIWHCLPNGIGADCAHVPAVEAWRQKLVDDLDVWERIVDSLNSAHNPEKPVCMIPGGQGLIKLYDAVMAGELPGISQMDALFEDHIHLNDMGRYYIALIHFAMLHNQNPQGLTNELRTQWGGSYDEIPTSAQAAVLQRLAWETVNEYPRTCLSGAISSSAQISSSSQHVYSSNQPSSSSRLSSVSSEVSSSSVLSSVSSEVSSSSALSSVSSEVSYSSALSSVSSGVSSSSALSSVSSGASFSSPLHLTSSEMLISSLEEFRSSDFFQDAHSSSVEYLSNGTLSSAEKDNNDTYLSAQSNSFLGLSSDALNNGVAGLYPIQHIKELSHAQFQQLLIQKSNVLLYDIMGRTLSVTEVNAITMQSGLYIIVINGERFSFTHSK